MKLDRKRAARLARWARSRKIPKSDVIRALIDRAGPRLPNDDDHDRTIATLRALYVAHSEFPVHVVRESGLLAGGETAAGGSDNGLFR